MQAAAGLLGLLALVAVWFVFARHGRKNGWGALKRHGFGAGLGFVAMIVVTLLFAPRTPVAGESTAAKTSTTLADPAPDAKEDLANDTAKRLETIKEMASGISELQEPDAGHLNVTQTKTSVWDEKAWANGVSLWAPAFLQKLAAQYPDRYKEVAIRFVVPTKDRYGNADTAEAMTLTYDMSEIAKVNWKGATPFDVLNLAAVYLRPMGRSGVTEWCEDGNDRFAGEFCSKAMQ